MIDALALDVARPAALLLLPLALLPLWREPRAERVHSSLALVPADRLSDAVAALLRGLAALAIAAIVLALAGLYRAEYELQRVGQGAEIVLLLDRSRSMDERFVSSGGGGAGGAKPGSSAWFAANVHDDAERITKGQAARRLLGEFAASRTQDRFAMTVFSTLPMPVLAFTNKAAMVQAAIAAGDVGRGLGETDIAAALLDGLSRFDGRAYTGSRILLLVSDGGDHIDPDMQLQIAGRIREQRVALYWIYLRSARSASLEAAGELTPAQADTVPEVFLHRYFQSIGMPYRAYEAENPEALQKAIADVGRLENLPIVYLERVPRRDLSQAAYAAALLALVVLAALRLLEHLAWRG